MSEHSPAARFDACSHTPQHQQTLGLGATHPVPQHSVQSLRSPLLPGPPQLTWVQVSTLMGMRGWGEGSAQRNLPLGDHFTPAKGSEYGPDRTRKMGSLMSRPRSPAPTQWVLPFALTLPNLPPQSTAPSWGRGGRHSLPSPLISPPSNRGDGTLGPYTGSPGPPTPSLGPVATPGRADVGAPREA